MNPENKTFLTSIVNKSTVSVASHNDIVMYHMDLPDGRPLCISAEYTKLDKQAYSIYYSVILDDEILEETEIDTKTKKLDPVATDIIDLMRMCNTKVLLQEAHLMNSKFMIHEVRDQKNQKLHS